MPQVCAHIVIADRVDAALGNPIDIAAHRTAYHLGAVGPDMMLFLFDPVGHSEALNLAIDTARTIQRVSAFFEEVAKRATGPAADYRDWVTGGLSTSIEGLAQLGYKTLHSVLLMQTIPGTEISIENPFQGMNIRGVPSDRFIRVRAANANVPVISALRTFGHPYTIDPPFRPAPQPRDVRNFYHGYDQWWWMDLLHYRRTGRFADALLQRAGNNHLLSAYSKGYWTHVAGDVCGHPYVNAIVGGPFRSHAIRHMVVENLIDTWVWQHDRQADLVSSRIDRLLDVGGDFDVIARHLVETMQVVYTDSQRHLGVPDIRPSHLPRPGIDDLRRAYQTMQLYLELSTGSGLAAPVPPPGSPQQFFQEIGQSLAGTAANIPQSVSNASNIWEMLLGAIVAAFYALVLLVKIATLPAAVLTRVATLAPRWLAYFIQVALYDYVRNTRWALALSGMGKVAVDDLQRPLSAFFTHLPPARTGVPMPAGMAGAFNYPYDMVPRQPIRQGFWLLDPAVSGAVLETQPVTESCPYPAAATPDVFITGNGYDQGRDQALRSFEFPAAGTDGPLETIGIERETIVGPQLGNAVEFATRLINGTYPAASFDLDADRGYGFISWQGLRSEYARGLT